jgi:prevent-host-death family protein
MDEVGIRALKQNASAVVAEAASGTIVTITDRGRPVAQLGPVRQSRLQNLLDSGQARPPRRKLSDLGPPELGPSVSAELEALRNAERY